jgi:ElaB/YqjD/DUF883 family membrane-anchored ribosome-binding protein
MDFKKHDLDAIASDIAALKKDLAKALDRFKDTAVETAVEQAQRVAEDIGDEVNGLYKDFTKRGQKSARSMGKHIEDQPITSLLVAFSVGFIMSKFLSR